MSSCWRQHAVPQSDTTRVSDCQTPATPQKGWRQLIVGVRAAEQGEASVTMSPARLYALSLEYRHHVSVARISLRWKVCCAAAPCSCQTCRPVAHVLTRLFANSRRVREQGAGTEDSEGATEIESSRLFMSTGHIVGSPWTSQVCVPPPQHLSSNACPSRDP